MNFLKMYYDRVLALVALLFVVVALFLLLFQIRKIHEGIVTEKLVPDNPPLVKAYDFSPLDQVLLSIERPSEWSTNTHRLFQPPLMIVDPNSGRPKRAALDEGPEIGPGGIPVPWYKRYDLDFHNKNIYKEDVDSDGYTNYDEFQGDSNPVDANSKPSPANKLRIVDIYQQDFPYLFVGYSEGQPGVYSIQLNHRKKGTTEYVQVGEKFGGPEKNSYLLKAITPKRERRFNPNLNKEVEEDASTITIVDKTGQDLTLEKNRTGKTNEWYAKLVYLRDGTELEVEEKEDIKLEGILFKVLRIQPKVTVDIPTGSVVITTTDEKTRTTITYELRPFNPKEDKIGAQPGVNEPAQEPTSGPTQRQPRRQPSTRPPPSAQ